MRSRRKDRASIGLLLKLLIVGLLAISIAQISLHFHPTQEAGIHHHLQPAKSTSSGKDLPNNFVEATKQSFVTPIDQLHNLHENDSSNSPLLTTSGGANGEYLSTLKEDSVTSTVVTAITSKTTTMSNDDDAAAAAAAFAATAAAKPLNVTFLGTELSYQLQDSNCATILRHQNAISTMDESSYSFIKFDRGKVPFSREFTACSHRELSIDTIHCLDIWLATHCREYLLKAVVGSGPQAEMAVQCTWWFIYARSLSRNACTLRRHFII